VKAVKYYSYDDIRLENRYIPTITDDELLVKVHGCGLCGSDILKIVQQAPPPVILGHELTGTIVKRGRAVTNSDVGQRVVVAHHVPCGHCHYCRHGNSSTCASFKASNIIFGLGSIGLLMLQAFKALGTGQSIPCGRSIRVYGIDLLPERLELARKLGADDAFLAPEDEQGLRSLLAPYTEGRGADAVIITVAGERPFLQAIAGVCKGGTIHIFAAHSAIVPVNLEHIYQQELGITSTYSSSPEELRIALDLLNSRAVRVDGLISHHLPLEQFAEAVTLMRQRAALKVYFQIAGES